MPPEPPLEPLRALLEKNGLPVPHRHGGDPDAGVAQQVDAGDVVVGVGEVEDHLLADPLGHVVEVGAVALRQHDLGQAHPVGGEHLLLDAADRQHLTLERDLAGHAHRRLHRPVAEQRDERRGHRDARRRPVLGNCPGRDVDVEPAPHRFVVESEVLGV